MKATLFKFFTRFVIVLAKFIRWNANRQNDINAKQLDAIDELIKEGKAYWSYDEENHKLILKMKQCMWPAIAMGVATMASKFASSAASRRHNDKQLQSQRNYNDPTSMMERYRRAGLNPYQDLGANGVGMSELGTPTTPDDFGSSAVNDGIDTAFSAIDNQLNFQRKKIDNEQAAFDLQFNKDLRNVREDMERAHTSQAKYQRDLQQMERNARVFTFQETLLNTFLNLDWVNRQLKNSQAIEIQKGSALEDELGLKMTESYGWHKNANVSMMGPFYSSYESNADKPTWDDPDNHKNEYYNFLYRGSKDKNNRIYQYFRNLYSNQVLESALHAKSLMGGLQRINVDNQADLYESMVNAADKQFDYACRNGFQNVDKNMLLFNGMKIVGGWIDGFVGNASSAYGSYLRSKSGHMRMLSDWSNRFDYQPRR